MKKIGRNIKYLRELRNLTQKYMADQLDMTQGNYARIENNTIGVSGERFRKISDILGYSMDFISNFDAERISDQPAIRMDTGRTEIHYLQISPELKMLYESKIQYLETHVVELKRQIKKLKDQA